MTANEFVETVARLPAEMQNEFIESLKEILTEEEWKSTVSYISLYAIYHNPGKYNALKKAVKAQIIEELFGHPYEDHEQKWRDPHNPVYMTTIV